MGASSPSGKGVGPMRPWTLVIIGVALTAATVRAFLAPFPGIALLLAGSVYLSVSRVWLEPRIRRGARGKLPAWPASPNDDAPALVVGELHHPTVPRESERPSWLVIPEKGLYTGVLVVGAVGTGKTTACMCPFAQQLLSWRADDPGRRAGALVLEVKGDFCHEGKARAPGWKPGSTSTTAGSCSGARREEGSTPRCSASCSDASASRERPTG